MVFVKVRETYDLHTIKNKMSVIAIHTPDSKIIQANFPGLLMQCKAYRPYSASVRVACASVLPVDPLGVGLAEGDVAPEDLFNPILYKACSNFGMSQIESRINQQAIGGTVGLGDVRGNTASVEVDGFTSFADEFPLYYGLLSNAHEWKHANPQQGLEMVNLRPLVYEVLYGSGDNNLVGGSQGSGTAPGADDNSAVSGWTIPHFLGNSKPMPMINCTAFNTGVERAGFSSPSSDSNILPGNAENIVPAPKIVVGCIIVPPSRLHELFYRMVVEWTLEFSMIRPLSEITNWNGLERLASITHYQNYDYEVTKKMITGEDDSVLDSDVSLASANVDLNKVM